MEFDADKFLHNLQGLLIIIIIILAAQNATTECFGTAVGALKVKDDHYAHPRLRRGTEPFVK